MTITIDLTKAAQVLIFGGFLWAACSCSPWRLLRWRGYEHQTHSNLARQPLRRPVVPVHSRSRPNMGRNHHRRIYAPVRSRPVIRITAASPAGGGRHEENTRSSGF